jgi:hypothetical protein
MITHMKDVTEMYLWCVEREMHWCVCSSTFKCQLKPAGKTSKAERTNASISSYENNHSYQFSLKGGSETLKTALWRLSSVLWHSILQWCNLLLHYLQYFLVGQTRLLTHFPLGTVMIEWLCLVSICSDAGLSVPTKILGKSREMICQYL